MTGVCEDFLYDYQGPAAPGGRCAAVLAPATATRCDRWQRPSTPGTSRVPSRITSRIPPGSRPGSPLWQGSRRHRSQSNDGTGKHRGTAGPFRSGPVREPPKQLPDPAPSSLDGAPVRHRGRPQARTPEGVQLCGPLPSCRPSARSATTRAPTTASAGALVWRLLICPEGKTGRQENEQGSRGAVRVGQLTVLARAGGLGAARRAPRGRHRHRTPRRRLTDSTSGRCAHEVDLAPGTSQIRMGRRPGRNPGRAQ